MKLQFVGLREFSETCSHANKLFVTEALAQFKYPFRNIINTITVLAETVCSIWSVNELLYI